MATELAHWICYHFGAPLYEGVLGAWTFGGWWRWQRRALDDLPRAEPILELGCGTGRLLAQRLASGPAVGIDMALPMLRRARQRLSDHPGGAPVLVADAGRLPFADGAFGAVISTGVLTVIPDPLPVLREARRVVRPGGRMAFVEMIPPQRKTVVSQAWIWALQRLRDRFHDIPQLLAELGLQVVDQEIGRAGTVHLVTAEVQ